MSFITIEGGEGTGKSTLIKGLAGALSAEGREVVQTREPGGSPGAEDIRALLVTGDADRWDAMTELLLVTAARRDHVERVIRPALARGATVLCDRYVDSTRAYQGMRGVPRDLIDRLHRDSIDLDPDRTLVLDLAPEEGLARAAERGGAARFEGMGLAYHQKLREAFLGIAKAERGRCRVVDAAAPPAEVLSQALAALDNP